MRFALTLVSVLLIPAGGAAQEAADTVAPGVIHVEQTLPEGPWQIDVLEVDLDRDAVGLMAARAHDGLFGRERVSDMAARLAVDGVDVIAGINGDFFDLDTGENENNQILDGRLVKGVRVTDSPWDTFDNTHTQFAVGVDGRPYLERFYLAAGVERADSDGRTTAFVLAGLNGVPRDGVGLALFTEARDAGSRGDSIRGAVELPLSRIGGEDAGEQTYGVVGGVRPVGTDSIAADEAVLAAYGRRAAAQLDSLVAGTGPIRFRYALLPDRGRLSLVVGGWPRLLVDGRNVAAQADSLEGTFPEFSAERHARSAVGVTRDSTTLLLVTVDGVPRGRETGPSAGMTLVELADLMSSLGAYQALNLDGGGSTTLVVGDRVVNAPTDPDGERAVGNALFVVRRSASEAAVPGTH